MTPIEHGHDPAAWLLAVIVLSLSLPWLVAIGWAWRHRVRDGRVFPSLGERLRERLVR